MILADENIDRRIIEALQKGGYVTISVYEAFRGLDDENIIVLATQEKLILLTEDKDFGEWVFAHHINSISVILLRYNFNDTKKIIDVLINLLKNIDQLKGKFTTVTIDKIRTRKI